MSSFFDNMTGVFMSSYAVLAPNPGDKKAGIVVKIFRPKSRNVFECDRRRVRNMVSEYLKQELRGNR